MRFAMALVLLLVAGCASEPERTVLPVEGNIVFRLGAKPEGVEVRLEAGFYPTSGYELVAKAEGEVKPETLKDGVTIEITGVRAPLEATGSRAQAAAVVFLPLGNTDGTPWPLLLKLTNPGGASRLDPYTVEHKASGWRLSRAQGGFSRFEANGSY